MELLKKDSQKPSYKESKSRQLQGQTSVKTFCQSLRLLSSLEVRWAAKIKGSSYLLSAAPIVEILDEDTGCALRNRQSCILMTPFLAGGVC